MRSLTIPVALLTLPLVVSLGLAMPASAAPFCTELPGWLERTCQAALRLGGALVFRTGTVARVAGGRWFSRSRWSRGPTTAPPAANSVYLYSTGRCRRRQHNAVLCSEEHCSGGLGNSARLHELQRVREHVLDELAHLRRIGVIVGIGRS
ncbi:MAG: hypothetical protein HC938_10720 [Nitrospira sp.]|nr:hypothetical protein [Nitrospira sp.]